MALSRTIAAEKFVEEFARIPLTAECVFYSPKYLDKSVEKELCDFLVILRREAILVSMKSQEDPATRAGDKLERWITKHANKALRQAEGALRTITGDSFYCHHSRRGRVDFTPGSLIVRHIVVLTEAIGRTVELPNDFPTSTNDIPVTYLSVNDFLNLTNELRAFPDILSYLQARMILPHKSLITVGDEVPLYKYYILNEKSFAGYSGYEDARIVAAARGSKWQEYLTSKPLTDKFARIIEFVSDALATRLESYPEGLRPEIVVQFDPTNNRRHYLLIQEELCDLRLSERHALGMQFTRVIDKVKKSNDIYGMAYDVFYTDSKDDFVYVLISAKGIDRPILIDRSSILLRAALAAYKKKRGMVIADRDGKGFEVQMIMIPECPDSPQDKKLGEHFFGHLRISDFEIS
jgi:hypothetical protein